MFEKCLHKNTAWKYGQLPFPLYEIIQQTKWEHTPNQFPTLVFKAINSTTSHNFNKKI